MCNCPSHHALCRSIDRWIDDRHWQLIGVGFESREPLSTRWLYTIGLAELFDHPELVVVGACCERCSGHGVNELARRVADGERFDLATVEPIEVLGLAVHLRPVSPACWTGDWFAMWRRYYGDKPYAAPPMAAVQLVLPDAGGRFPWEPGCDPALAARQQMPDQLSATPRPPRGRRERRAARHRR
jgi:hypothetical protein